MIESVLDTDGDNLVFAFGVDDSGAHPKVVRGADEAKVKREGAFRKGPRRAAFPFHEGWNKSSDGRVSEGVCALGREREVAISNCWEGQLRSG